MKVAAHPSQSTELLELQRELVALRSFVIGFAGRDSEGVYRPETVRRLLRAAQELPIAEFQDPQQFLELLNQTEE